MAATAARKRVAKVASKVFDVDAARAEYVPVRVRFHGKDYDLGKTALSLVRAPDLFADEDGKDGDGVSAARMIERLPEALGILCEELGEAVAKHGLSAPEELLLLSAVTEVLSRVGGGFRAEEAAG